MVHCKLLDFLQLNELLTIQVAGMKQSNFDWDLCQRAAADLNRKEMLGMLQACLELVVDISIWQPVECVIWRRLMTHTSL